MASQTDVLVNGDTAWGGLMAENRYFDIYCLLM